MNLSVLANPTPHNHPGGRRHRVDACSQQALAEHGHGVRLLEELDSGHSRGFFRKESEVSRRLLSPLPILQATPRRRGVPGGRPAARELSEGPQVGGACLAPATASALLATNFRERFRDLVGRETVQWEMVTSQGLRSTDDVTL